MPNSVCQIVSSTEVSTPGDRQTDSLLGDRPGRKMSPTHARWKNVFMSIKYLFSYSLWQKYRAEEIIYRQKPKDVWSGHNPWGYRNFACYGGCSFFPPSTIQTGSLCGNAAYLHLRSSVRGFCTCCSWSNFLLKSNDSRTIYIHRHTHTWVEISTSSVFSL